MATQGRRYLVIPAFLAAACFAAAACGLAPERPLLAATGLHFHKPGVTGLPVDVTFRVQNPNPKALVIERFSYDVFVNDQSIGRGFVPQALTLAGFQEQQVVSQFSINYFSVPGAVKLVLDRDRIDAKIRGVFYVKGRFRTSELPFESAGAIPLGREAGPK